VLVCLMLPPVLWSANAVVGRLMVGVLPPVTMNAVRWLLVGLLLLPLARRALAHPREWLSRWRHFIWLGGLGVGCYNAMQYLALHTASPVNVTLIGSSVPVWMMLVGLVAYGQVLLLRQLLGAVLSIGGVMLVMSKGQWSTFEHWQWGPGDLYMLAASLAWAIYSWMLARPPSSLVGPERPLWTWADFLWVQIVFGLLWGVAGTTLEHTLIDQSMGWDWLRDPKAWGALLFLAVGPSIIAYQCWGVAVQAVGPTITSFFGNFTPLFAALWSLALLGDAPRWYHAAAFVLILLGIALSSGLLKLQRRSPPRPLPKGG
jgi:drug/metabolite transporter (DMT)-like permease